MKRIILFLILLNSFINDTAPARETSLQNSYFDQLKSKFKYNDLTYLTNQQLPYHGEVKLNKVDSLNYKWLFSRSKIFNNFEGTNAMYYSFSKKAQYYQLVFAGLGHYKPDLILFHYAHNGSLIHEQVIATSFFDAGLGTETNSYFQGDSLMFVADLNFSERPVGQLCDSTVTSFKINSTGVVVKTGNKKYKTKCR